MDRADIEGGFVEKRLEPSSVPNLAHAPRPSDAAFADPKQRLSISVVSINYRPDLTGIAVYSSGMAEYFAAAGHATTVHTGFSYYPTWVKRREDHARVFRSEHIEGVRVRRCYLYVPERPTALRRMLHEFSFVVCASVSYLLAARTDVTVIVSPPLLLGIPIALLARLKSSKTVFHVQDLQPDAAVDLQMLRPGLLTRLLFAIERWTYLLVDRVSTISCAMRAKIISKNIPPEKVWIFKNWANDEFLTGPSPTSGNEGRNSEAGRFLVLYAGNMGVKQGLGSVLDAASLLSDLPNVVFVIVGAGGEKEALVARAIATEMRNVEFRPPVPQHGLAELLANADISIIPQKTGVKDIVLPSKLGNLLLSRRPVIAAAAMDSELAEVIRVARCGLVVEPGDGKALALAVRQLMDDPTERRAMGERGQVFAHAHLRRAPILDEFLARLIDLSAVRVAARGGA